MSDGTSNNAGELQTLANSMVQAGHISAETAANALAIRGGAAAQLASDSAAVDLFTAEQQREMARWLVEDGHITQEQADAMLRADGANAQPDPNSRESRVEALREDPEAAELLDVFPPAGESEYDFKDAFADAVADPATTQEAQELNLQIRGALADALFPREIGSALIAEAADIVERWSNSTEAQRDLYRQEQDQILRRMWGDAYSEKLALARRLAEELESKRPGIMDLLEAGPGDSAFVIAQIYEQASRLYDLAGIRDKQKRGA